MRDLSTDEASEVFALRLKLEPGAVADAPACALTPADHAAAEKALAALEAELAKPDGDHVSLNRAFHLAMIRPGGHIAFQLMERLQILAERYVRVHLEPNGRDERRQPRASRDPGRLDPRRRRDRRVPDRQPHPRHPLGPEAATGGLRGAPRTALLLRKFGTSAVATPGRQTSWRQGNLVTGSLRNTPPEGVGAGKAPARMFTCRDGRSRVGAESFASRAVRRATNASSAWPSAHGYCEPVPRPPWFPSDGPIGLRAR
ncbi:FCD domain-containing protein [Caulobacter segnis]